MKAPMHRKPLFKRLKTGMQEAIRHSKGEIALKTMVIEIPDPPPSMRADEVVRLRLDHAMSQAVFARLLDVAPKPSRAGTRRAQTIDVLPFA